MYLTFGAWTQGRSVASLGTNSGSAVLPFQKWRHFKEAFAPEIVEEAVRSSKVDVRCCLDPFGGSGTTALACQFLGVKPVTIEVNPYLADLIEAKLARYESDELIRAAASVLRLMNDNDAAIDGFLGTLPATFVEPGVDARWLFGAAAARRLMALRAGIEALPCVSTRRLFRVLLGGIMVDVSNALVNGKGRRYRRAWQSRQQDASDVTAAFTDAVSAAIAEIHKYSQRLEVNYEVIRGDARAFTSQADQFDLAVFSPPYPNSFDYTDVYNIELWMLGYINSSGENRELRQSTLASHVQVDREFADAPRGSETLNHVLTQLESVRDQLWSRKIPKMVASYFSDMLAVIQRTNEALVKDGTIWMVVGDSRYANIHVPAAQTLVELATNAGLQVERYETLRDMRVSAQQGGMQQLAESLVVLRKP